MSEGVQASPGPAVGHPHGMSAAIAPIVMGLVGAFGYWNVPSGSLAGKMLLITAIGLIVAGAAVVVLRLTIHDPRDYYGGLALLGSGDVRDLGVERPARHARLRLRSGHRAAAVRRHSRQPRGSASRWSAASARGRGSSAMPSAVRCSSPCRRSSSPSRSASFGLVIASFVSIMISAAGSSETSGWRRSSGRAVLTAFCALLFPYALNLPMPLWPQNLTLVHHVQHSLMPALAASRNE